MSTQAQSEGEGIVLPSPWQSPKYTGKPWWTKDTVAVVTGSNRGIGYNTLRVLAQHGLTTIMTDIVDTKASLAALQAEGLGDLVFHHPLDVTSTSAVATLADWIKGKFGGIDILINNAGVTSHSFNEAVAKHLIGVNYSGVKNVTEGLLPLMKPGGRIINVTSRTGFYQRLSGKLRDEFQDVNQLSIERLDALAEKFIDDFKSGQLEKEGWLTETAMHSLYSTSKMLLSSYTLVLSRTLQAEGKNLHACAFCPGVTDTDMIRGQIVLPGLEPHPVEVGIDTGVWLALLPPDEIAQNSGKLFGERAEFPYTWDPWVDPFAPGFVLPPSPE